MVISLIIFMSHCLRFSKMIRGHCVFWAVDTEVPFWAKKLPNDKLKKKMKERLQTLLFRYRGRWVSICYPFFKEKDCFRNMLFVYACISEFPLAVPMHAGIKSLQKEEPWNMFYLSGNWAGAPNVNFRKISVRKTIWDLEFSEHFL